MVKEKKTPKIRPEYRVVSSGALDLANFAGEIVSNPDTVLVSLGGELKNYAKLLRDDQVHSLLEQRQDALIAAEWEVVPGGEDSRDREAADFLRGQLMALNWDAITRRSTRASSTATPSPNASGAWTGTKSPSTP